jgi:signal transduction histidine kinase
MHVPQKAHSPSPDPAARIAELEAALSREQSISAALREVGAAVGSIADLDDLLELILERLKDLLDADRAILYLVDQATGDLVSQIAAGDEIRSVRMQVGQGIAGIVARTGKTIRVRDAYRDRRFVRAVDQLVGSRTQSMIAAPLRTHDGKLIGVVQVVNKKRGRDFDASDETLFIALATQAAISIDLSRLFLSVTQKNMELTETKEKLEQSVRHLKLLFDLESAMNRAATLDELVKEALRRAAAATDSAAGGVLLLDDNAGLVELSMWDREDPDVLAREAVRMGTMPQAACTSLLSKAIDTGEPARGEIAWRDGQTHVALSVPLDGEDSPLGAVILCGKQGARIYPDEDIELLRLVAANFSTAVRLFRARALREREQRMSTIGSLLSSLVHDLKSPMAVIHGCVEMMATAKGEAERVKYADLIVSQLGLVSAMQREVLEFARGETKALVRKVYLGKFFGDLLEQLRREVDPANVALSLDLADKGTARFDQNKITRAVHNLARNAIEAMGKKGGELVIRVRRDAVLGKKHLVLSVADTGPGIPKEIEARLFQSFVSAGKKGGTGLGLAIVKKIVEEHGGTVAATTSPAGTTITMSLPQDDTK